MSQSQDSQTTLTYRLKADETSAADSAETEQGSVGTATQPTVSQRRRDHDLKAITHLTNLLTANRRLLNLTPSRLTRTKVAVQERRATEKDKPTAPLGTVRAQLNALWSDYQHAKTRLRKDETAETSSDIAADEADPMDESGEKLD